METLHIQAVSELDTVAQKVFERISVLNLPHASVLTLQGELGAGKTTFMQVFAKMLGIEEVVISPTYVIMKRYDIPSSNAHNFTTLFHIDAYRIDDVHQMEVLGFLDILKDPNTLVCIEWPQRIKELIPKDAVQLSIVADTQDSRSITLT